MEPGKYYWKADNGYIKSFVKKFVVDSRVALSADNEELMNVGDVKLNITKLKNGSFIGEIYLSPHDSVDINVSDVEYRGRQDE